MESPLVSQELKSSPVASLIALQSTMTSFGLNNMSQISHLKSFGQHFSFGQLFGSCVAAWTSSCFGLVFTISLRQLAHYILRIQEPEEDRVE